MTSSAKPNGLPPVIGMTSDPSKPSRTVIPTLPSLRYSKLTHARTTSKDHHFGRHSSWNHGRYGSSTIWQKRVITQPETSVRALAHLVLLGFAVLSIGVAFYAVQQEQRLTLQEQQVLRWDRER